MSDEPTSDDTTPGDATPGDATPAATESGADATASAPVLDTDTTQQVPVSEPDATETAASPPSSAAPTNGSTGERRGIFVPRWLAIVAGVVVAVLLVGGGGFALGRSTADDDETRVATTPAPTPDRGDTPSTPSRPSTPDLPDTPALSSAYLGVSVDPTSSADGVEITEVADDSPAADAGLEAGDVITEIDGEQVTSFAELAEVVADHEPGDEVEITYERDGESDTVTVTLGERPAISSRPGGSGSGDSGSGDSSDEDPTAD